MIMSNKLNIMLKIGIECLPFICLIQKKQMFTTLTKYFFSQNLLDS